MPVPDSVTTRFYWDAPRHRWRDGETGRFVAESRVREGRDGFLVSQERRVGDLTQRLTEGMPVQRFEAEMRQVIKSSYLAEYMLGRGGLNAMTNADNGRVGALCRTQYQYLRDFMLQVQRGELSPAQIGARAALYVRSAGQAYERARAAVRDLVLPAYPKDGTSECKSNCRCTWDIREADEEWRCYWRVSSKETCPTCLQRGQSWSPLVVPKSFARTLADLRGWLRVRVQEMDAWC